MCVPVSVATKGASGCVGICRVWPQVIGMIVLAGIVVWNFAAGRLKALKAKKSA